MASTREQYRFKDYFGFRVRWIYVTAYRLYRLQFGNLQNDERRTELTALVNHDVPALLHHIEKQEEDCARARSFSDAFRSAENSLLLRQAEIEKLRYKIADLERQRESLRTALIAAWCKADKNLDNYTAARQVDYLLGLPVEPEIEIPPELRAQRTAECLDLLKDAVARTREQIAAKLC